MKHKTMTALAKTASVFVLGLFLHTQAAAQTDAASGKASGAVPANRPVLMNPNGEAPQERNAAATAAPVVVDAQGAVQVTAVTEDGQTVTQVVSRPAVDATQEMKAGFESWQRGFHAWMKANPNHESYLTQHEVSLLHKNDNLVSLYRYQHAVASRSQTRN